LSHLVSLSRNVIVYRNSPLFVGVLVDSQSSCLLYLHRCKDNVNNVQTMTTYL